MRFGERHDFVVLGVEHFLRLRTDRGERGEKVVVLRPDRGDCAEDGHLGREGLRRGDGSLVAASAEEVVFRALRHRRIGVVGDGHRDRAVRLGGFEDREDVLRLPGLGNADHEIVGEVDVRAVFGEHGRRAERAGDPGEDAEEVLRVDARMVGRAAGCEVDVLDTLFLGLRDERADHGQVVLHHVCEGLGLFTDFFFEVDHDVHSLIW